MRHPPPSPCASQETRELLEGLRTEASSRVRMLKERLDRTDRELLRQLEESQNSDKTDKFEALQAVLDTKVRTASRRPLKWVH